MSDTAQFIEACKTGQIGDLKVMIEMDPALVDSRGDDQIPALIHATCANRIDVVDLLLSSGADIEVKDADFQATAIGFAAWHGWFEVAALLVERGADVDGMGEEPSPLALALDGADGKLTSEGSPGTRDDHAAIAALLKSRNARVIGRIGEARP